MLWLKARPPDLGKNLASKMRVQTEFCHGGGSGGQTLFGKIQFEYAHLMIGISLRIQDISSDKVLFCQKAEGQNGIHLPTYFRLAAFSRRSAFQIHTSTLVYGVPWRR